MTSCATRAYYVLVSGFQQCFVLWMMLNKKRCRCRLQVGFTVLALLLVCVLLSLGRWQLQRYAQKNSWQRTLQTATTALAWEKLPAASRTKTHLQYRTLSIKGHFIEKQQLLLDNCVRDGVVGYDVLTPFVPQGEQRVVLVDRGWIPAAKERAAWPTLPPLLPVATVTGLAKFPEGKPFMLGLPRVEGADWPKRISHTDAHLLQQVTGHEVHPFVLLLRDDQGNGFARNWHVTGMAPLRHLGYAVQWFAMALAVCVIVVVLSCRRIREEE